MGAHFQESVDLARFLKIRFLRMGRFQVHKIGFSLEIRKWPISDFKNPGFRSHKTWPYRSSSRHIIMPSPPETWFSGMGWGLSSGFEARLALEKGDTNLLSPRPSQLVDKRWHLGCVWTVSRSAPLPNSNIFFFLWLERVARGSQVLLSRKA